MLSKISSNITKICNPILFKNSTPAIAFNIQRHVALSVATRSIRHFSTKKDSETVLNNPPVFYSDKEFQEAADNVDIQSEQASFAFQTDLQATSIKLLKATSSSEVLDIYENELSKKSNWTGEELCLVLYFACYYKTDVTDDSRFSELVQSIFSKLDEISSLYLFTLIHSLGIYCFDFGLSIPVTDQQKLGILILKNLDNFELNQISAISWSTAQILSSSENKDLKEEAVGQLGALLLRNAVSLTGLDYANILSTFSQCGVKDQELLDKFTKSIKANIEKLEGEDLNNITRLIMALGELNLKDTSVLVDLFENILRPQIHNFSVDDVCALMLVYADKFPDRQHYFRELVKNVHVNYTEMTITSYLNVWLTMAKYRFQASALDKTLNIMRRALGNKVWKIDDLEGFELVNILIAMSTMKVNDKEFLYLLTSGLASHLRNLENGDLVNLVRAYTLYVKQNEEFYLEIHKECVNRENHLSSQDKRVLKETFTKAKKYLPESPFVDVTLY